MLLLSDYAVCIKNGLFMIVPDLGVVLQTEGQSPHERGICRHSVAVPHGCVMSCRVMSLYAPPYCAGKSDAKFLYICGLKVDIR